ncbi:MAG TPA: LuxR C-terminal-related transcriptional regulator [Phycisphaerales bacterium]|nr:LuxR C-terminal-related transcriptional regulator [Phycisphaerales bacterium]
MGRRSADETWDRLLQDIAEAPGIGLGIVTVGGLILYHNAEAARLHFGDAGMNVVGRRIDELYPPEWVEGRLAAYRRVVESGRTMLMRSLHRGVHIETTLRPIASEEGEEPTILLILRPGRTPDDAIPAQTEVLEHDAVSLGPLGVLTPRELEVLALIGRGQSAREIGTILGCSPRTVERHRDAIGKKLRKSDRVELALIAHAAGLELRDARRKRIEPLVGPGRMAERIFEPKAPNDSRGAAKNGARESQRGPH